MKQTREIEAPRNSHFHARPRPMNKKAPRTRGIIGKGVVLGWSRNTTSAIKKNKTIRINRRLMMRAIHRITLIILGPGDDILFKISSFAVATLQPFTIWLFPWNLSTYCASCIYMGKAG
ncbi:MAG: hypothetical protein KAS21_09005 [Candidatus Aminicenantes bacterium]|nr:hypothetical protein [Candidatus Aminicenantes bacterium]